VKISGITNYDHSYHFDDQKDGYAVTVKVKLENKSDKIAHATDYMFTLKNSKENIGAKLSPKSQKSLGNNETKLKAGESWEGVLTYPMSENDYKAMISAPINLEISAFVEDGKAANVLLPKQQVPIALNEEGKKQVENAAGQYPDEIIQKHYATKEILKEQKDLKLENEFNGLHMTVNGIQYAKVTPVAEYARLFTSFKDGINSITIKLDVKNNTEFDFDTTGISPWLLLNNSSRLQSQGAIFETNEKSIKKGEQKTLYVTYLMNKLDYDGLSKLGLRYSSFSSISAGKTVMEPNTEIELPFQK
jgi:hypothetical protein